MLAGPAGWWVGIPAAVPDFGPFNEHFVRDIGCAFLTVGVALAWAARRPAVRFPLLTVAALFLGAHALLHVFDTGRGAVEPAHWWIDFPGVYLPAALAITLALHARPSQDPNP